MASARSCFVTSVSLAISLSAGVGADGLSFYIAYMSQPTRFVNHGLKHFFPPDVEGPWDGSNQFWDAFPYPFADDNFEAVQWKLIDEQGDVGTLGTSCVSSNQRIGCS